MRALGGFWRALGWRREDHEIAPGAMGRPSEVLGGAMGDLSLRFPVFGCQGARNIGKRKSGGPSDALALRLCSQIVQGRVRFDFHLKVKGGVSGPGREPLRRVQGPLLLIQYTCYLILDTRHLILDTCTYILDT